MNLKILKEAHHSLRESCAQKFRKEAMGGNSDGGADMVQDLEIKLRASISEKYRQIKAEFTRIGQRKAQKHLDQVT